MSAPNATMEGQYAFVQDLVGSIPELATLVQQASAQKATPDAFAAMLQSTTWWRTNSANARQMVALQASDPTTYNQQISQAQSHVASLAGQLGVQLSPAQVASLATADLYQGMNDDLLKENIGGLFGGGTVAQTGDTATYQQALQQLAYSYGVPVTSTWMNNYVTTALTHGQSEQEMIAGATQDLTSQATASYPTLAAQLAAGQTTQQIAQPYIAQMSQTLELPDTQIGLTDPLIQRALSNPSLTPGSSGTNTSKPTGTAATANTAGSAPSTSGTANAPGATTMPLYQFQDMLRADPRWQQTDNAKASAYSLVAGLGKSFGFAS